MMNIGLLNMAGGWLLFMYLNFFNNPLKHPWAISISGLAMFLGVFLLGRAKGVI